MPKLLILGGTGFVGTALCEALLRRHGPATVLRVPSRRPERAKGRIGTLPSVELLAADVHDEAQLVRLMQGCEAVIHLVAILHGRPADFQRVHVELPAKVGRAARAAGVGRLLHVSALGVAADAPSHYLRSKAAGEAALREAGAPGLTVLRPSVIFGAGDRFLNTFAALQTVAPLLPLAGADAQFQPVWVQDVAEALVRCLDDASTAGETIEAAGPRVWTLAELVRLAGRLAGVPRPVLPMPDPVGRLQAAVMGLLPGEPLMSADNLDSMKVPNIASGRLPGLARLGLTPTALEAVAPGYLGGGASASRLDAWRSLARR